MEIPTPLTGGHIGWIDLLGIIIMSAPAVIAAVSSLKNGRILKTNGIKVAQRAKRKAAKKKTPKGEPGEEGQDWFSPPDLGSSK